MRKEIIFAILAGLVLGVIIAFGVWRANTVLKSETSDGSIETLNDSSLSSQSSGLTVASPETDDVITESPILVSGLTQPNSWVILSGETEDYILQADTSGNFEQEVALAGGVNQIIIRSVSEDQAKETILRVVYSTEFDNPLGSEESQSDPNI